MGVGCLPAPHGPQKHNTKDFNPCASITKDSTSARIPTSDGRAGGKSRHPPGNQQPDTPRQNQWKIPEGVTKHQVDPEIGAVLKPSTENNIILFGGSFPAIRSDKSRFTRKQTVQSAAAINSVHSNKVTLARATGANSFSLSVKQKTGRVLTFNHDSSGYGAPRRTEQLLTTSIIVHRFNWNRGSICSNPIPRLSSRRQAPRSHAQHFGFSK